MSNPPRYLLYVGADGREYLARIRVEAQVAVTWQDEAGPEAGLPGCPGRLEDMAAQGYYAVLAVCDPICDEVLANVQRYWVTPAEAAQVIEGLNRPPQEVPDAPSQ